MGVRLFFSFFGVDFVIFFIILFVEVLKLYFVVFFFFDLFLFDCCDICRWNSSYNLFLMFCEMLCFLGENGGLEFFLFGLIFVILRFVILFNVFIVFGIFLDLKFLLFIFNKFSLFSEFEFFCFKLRMFLEIDVFLISLCMRCLMFWEIFVLCWK